MTHRHEPHETCDVPGCQHPRASRAAALATRDVVNAYLYGQYGNLKPPLGKIVVFRETAQARAALYGEHGLIPA